MSRLKQGRDILRNRSICLDQRQACPTRRERNIPEGLVCRRGRQFTRFKRLTLWGGGGGPRTSDEDKDGVPRTSDEDKDGVPRTSDEDKDGVPRTSDEDKDGVTRTSGEDEDGVLRTSEEDEECFRPVRFWQRT